MKISRKSLPTYLLLLWSSFAHATGNPDPVDTTPPPAGWVYWQFENYRYGILGDNRVDYQISGDAGIGFEVSPFVQRRYDWNLHGGVAAPEGSPNGIRFNMKKNSSVTFYFSKPLNSPILNFEDMKTRLEIDQPDVTLLSWGEDPSASADSSVPPPVDFTKRPIRSVEAKTVYGDDGSAVATKIEVERVEFPVSDGPMDGINGMVRINGTVSQFTISIPNPVDGDFRDGSEFVGFTIGDSLIVGFNDTSGEKNPSGNWSEHSSLGWVFDTYTGWQYAYSQGTWFWIDGQWGWTEDTGWHWLGDPGWIYRIEDGVWYQPDY